MKKRAFGYVRVSTEQQVDSTLGIRGYINECHRYADAYGLDLGEEGVWGRGADKVPCRSRVLVEEGESAWKTRLADRPKGRELCISVEPGDTIIIPCFTRAFRNTKDCIITTELWDSIGVKSIMLDAPVQGPAMRALFAAIAQWESEARSQRTKDAHRHSRVAGRPIGNRDPDPGFTFKKVNGRRMMVPCQQELDVLALVRQWRKEGASRHTIWKNLFYGRYRVPAWGNGRGGGEYKMDRVRLLIATIPKIEAVEERTGKPIAEADDDWWQAYREYDLELRDERERKKIERRQLKELMRYRLEMASQ